MEAEFEALKRLLDENGIKYSAYSHEKIRTAEEAARVRSVPLSAGVKSIVIETEDGFCLVLVPGDRKADFARLPVKNAKLADPKDVFRITGCEVGSVHPFGALFGLRVFMDRHVLDNAIVHFSAGTHENSISMSPKDIAKIAEAEVGDFSISR